MSWEICVVDTPAESDARRIEAFVADSPSGHFFQYPLLDRVEDGPPVRRICAWAEAGGILGATAVARLHRLRGVGPWTARIDRGPVVGDVSALEPLLDAIIARLRAAGAVSVRVNPLRRRDDDGGVGPILDGMGFAPVSDFDYDVTLEVEIDRDADALLASFAKGTRYAIRQAMKAGVACDATADDAAIGALERLYASMVRRKGATARPPGFFRTIAGFLRADPSRGFVLASRLEGEIVGVIVVTRYGRRALYSFGASSDADDGVPKMHLLQYRAMVAARALGCTVYDLGGFSAGTGEEGARTPAQRINFFKSRFSKNEVELIPCRERVLRPFLNRLVAAAREVSGARATRPARGRT